MRLRYINQFFPKKKFGAKLKKLLLHRHFDLPNFSRKFKIWKVNL